MKHTTILLFAFALLLDLQAEPADFSEKDKIVIYTHSLDIIRDYQRLINEMGEYAISDPEAAQSSSESFLELFVNRQVLIYNDLDPSHNLSPFYEAETYITNVLLWYPDGMRIALDYENAKVGNIMQHEDDIFSLDIMLTKKIDGNYLNRMQNQNTEEILFRIAFSRRMGGFTNYKIVGIRNSDASMIPDYSKNLEEVKSEEMDENDIFKMEEGMRAVMQDYVNYIALLGDPQEFEEDKEFYRESFSALFEDDAVRVYNDLAPEPEKSLLSVEEYMSSLKNDYPKGISNVSMPIDSADIGKPIKTDEGFYYATMNVDKFFSGNFQDKQAYREMFPLTVRIRFERSGNAFTDFKIQSVDIEADDFYEAEQGTEELALPTMSISTVSRKGWSVGIEGGYGLSPVENQNISALTLDNNYHAWESQPGYGIRAGINVFYYMNERLGIKTGLLYNAYQTLFTLDGLFTNEELSRDVNDDQFNQIVDASYDSTVTLNYISLPIVLNYSTGKPGDFGFYLEAGGVLGYKISASYNTTGSYNYYGYYPYHPAAIQTLDLEVLGFYKEENINRSGDLPVSGINLSGYASFGINIPMGYFNTIRIGPEIHYGIMDIDTGDAYTDIFGNQISRQPTILKKYSVKISYILKL
jgi:hypothetical protein